MGTAIDKDKQDHRSVEDRKGRVHRRGVFVRRLRIRAAELPD
jgi:hypothetical protein